jgi:hypothetical protein
VVNRQRQARVNEEARAAARMEIPEQRAEFGHDDQDYESAGSVYIYLSVSLPLDISSGSSVDILIDGPEAQVPSVRYPGYAEMTSGDKKSDRLLKSVIKKTEYRISPTDKVLIELLNQYIDSSLSMEDKSDEIADALNQMIQNKPELVRVNVTTRSNALVRQAILSNRKFSKIPMKLLEDILLQTIGPGFRVSERIATVERRIMVARVLICIPICI